jgi:uncharacterized protein DUF992
MTNSLRTLFGATTIAALALAAPAALASEAGVKAGTLTCNVSSGWGFILGSSKDIRCSYSPGEKRYEHYQGQIKKFGVDIGYTQEGVIVWGVFAPSTDVQPGALAGDYVGATASATVGVGVGAHALVGGSGKSFTLQPLSVEGNTGLNVAGGIGALNLKYVP